jgi:hypothetical protein
VAWWDDQGGKFMEHQSRAGIFFLNFSRDTELFFNLSLKIFKKNRMMSKTSHQSNEKRQIIISNVLIRRGGAPSGAAEFIIFGGMGVSTPISNS